MKLFAVVRYGPSGQPIKFLSHSANNWQTNLDRNCLWHEKDKVEQLANEVDGFVETYNVEREMPKVIRSELPKPRNAFEYDPSCRGIEDAV